MTVLINGTTGITTPGLTNEGSQTISTGTANGVTYLNGSKVLTSGSALTYNGTTLTNTAGETISAGFTSNATGGEGGQISLQNPTNTGLVASFDVANATTARLFTTVNNATINIGQLAGTGGVVAFTTEAIERMRIDSSGNLGLGVTPSAWGSFLKAFQIHSGSLSVAPTDANLQLTNNGYFDGTNWVYQRTDFSAKYDQVNGQHAWYNALSGTAGNAISWTQAMTLDASGRLLLGPTSGTGMSASDLGMLNGGSIRFRNAANSAYLNMINVDSSNNLNFGVGGVPTAITFGISGIGEAARIDSSGNLSLTSGTFSAIGVYNNTTASAANLHVSSAGGLFFRSTSALKYKQDIRDLESMDIGLLRPVRYKSKCEGDDQTKDHLGLIADEAAGAGFEELVTRGADGEVEGFQYERLTVVLLKELQTLRARVTALEGN